MRGEELHTSFRETGDGRRETGNHYPPPPLPVSRLSSPVRRGPDRPLLGRECLAGIGDRGPGAERNVVAG